MYTHDRGVRYSLPSGTDDIDGKTMQSGNGRRWGKFQHVVLLGGFIQQQFPLIQFMEKNLLRCKVDRSVCLHILLVTLHSPASCEDGFFSKYFMYSNVGGIHYYS